MPGWKRKLSDLKPLLLWSALLVLIDQIAKLWLRATLPVGQVYRPELALSQYVRLVHLKNYGGLGGFLENYSWLVSLLSILVSLAIVYYYTRLPSKNRVARLGMILLFSGGVGNLIDRLLTGSVTDFISILWLPVMNIADLYVLAGLAALVLGVDDSDRRKSPAKPSQNPGEPASPSEEARR